MEIRILGAGDDHVLQSAGADVFDDPLDPAMTTAVLGDPRHHIVVALEDDAVIGFASAVHYIHPDKRRAELWINEVSVAASHQKRGTASAILHRLFDLARDLGCGEAWVLTSRTNNAAMALYTSCGGVQAPAEQVMFSFPLSERSGRCA